MEGKIVTNIENIGNVIAKVTKMPRIQKVI
jgi:hypothetical protein